MIAAFSLVYVCVFLCNHLSLTLYLSLFRYNVKMSFKSAKDTTEEKKLLKVEHKRKEFSFFSKETTQEGEVTMGAHY